MIGQAKVVDQLRDPGHDPGAFRKLAQERKTPGRCRIAEGARDEEAFSTLLERPGRGDQRAAPGRRLDDHGRVREPADDPVASREVPRLGATSGASSDTIAPPAATMDAASRA